MINYGLSQIFSSNQINHFKGGTIGSTGLIYNPADLNINPSNYFINGSNSLKKAFNIIDKRDSNPNNQYLDNEYTRPVTPFYQQTEESKAILNNLYQDNTPEGKVGAQNFKFNELGTYIAGEDGKISYNELKALDTDNDNKISQAEYDAKKAEMEQQNDPPTENALQKAFNIIDKRDSNPNNQYLDNEYTRPVTPAYQQTEESKAIINNLYQDKTPDGLVGAQKYEFNELGTYIAGDDGKISYDELKALDTDNDNKISQAEYDAKKAEMEQQNDPTDPEALVDTKSLLNSIISSDINNDGKVSRSEINTQANQIESQINFFQMLKQFIPFMANLLDPMINQLQETLKPLKLVKENYDAFSDAGKDPESGNTEHQIDGKSLIELITSAASDGNINDFSNVDLNNLLTKKPVAAAA